MASSRSVSEQGLGLGLGRLQGVAYKGSPTRGRLHPPHCPTIMAIMAIMAIIIT